MVIKYKNDVEELIDLNLLTVKLSKKKWFRNNMIPIIYGIVSILVCAFVILFYGGIAQPQNKILIFVLIICNSLFWVRVLLASRTVYRKSVLKMLRKNPSYGQSRSVTRKQKEFYIQNLEDSSKSYSIKVKDVARVVRKDDYIVMYGKNYTPLLMFPESLVKGNLGEEEFFNDLKVENIK